MALPASPALRFVPGVEPLDDRITPSALTTRASLDANGAQAVQASAAPSVSADGRFVAFETTAALVATDTNGTSDVYLTDRTTGTVSLVSVDAVGNAAGGSTDAAISGNGRYVAFESTAGLLVGGFAGQSNIFVRDLTAGTTTAVSKTAAGLQPNASSFAPSISDDGGRIAFESNATNIVGGFGGTFTAVFAYDQSAGTTAAVSLNAGGTGANAGAFNAAVSGNGRFVAFESAASDIVGGFGGNGRSDVFVRDLANAATLVASRNAANGAANGDSILPSISGDGRYVAFESDATNIVAGFGGATTAVFVRDLQANTSAAASRNANGNPANADSLFPVISGNGRYVAFISAASDIVAGFGGVNSTNVYVWDAQGTATVAASKNASGAQANAAVASTAAISRNGEFVAFVSTATDLLAPGTDTNGRADVFVNQRPLPVVLATGAGPGGGPLVKVFNPDGSLKSSFLGYSSSYTGGVFVATGDVTGDGVPDLVTSTGLGGSANIRVYDGLTGALLNSFFGYPPAFTGGVNVALGDVNNDGYADIVCGVGAGGGPNVRVFSGKDGTLLLSFFAYASAFTGGVRVASADLNRDGYADIICGVGSGGGPNVKVFDGRTGALLQSYFAYASTFAGGLFVSAGDVNNDGVPDIITGVESGGGPNVRAFDWRSPSSPIRSLFAFDTTQVGGVRVAGADVNGDGFADFLTGTGTGPGSLARVISGKDAVTQLLGQFAPFGAFRGGVNVG